MFKNAFLAFPRVLLHVLSLSTITLAEFPDSWKEPMIISIVKINNAATLSDLHPISVLSLLGKLMEKVIASQLNSHLENNSLLTPQQAGYIELDCQ